MSRAAPAILFARHPSPLVLACEKAFDAVGAKWVRCGDAATGLPGLADIRCAAFVWIPSLSSNAGREMSLPELQARISDVAWPVFDALHAIHRAHACFPKYVVAVSAGFVDSWQPGSDLDAAAFASLETLCKYAAARLAPDGVRLNVVRRPPPGNDPFFATDAEVADVIVSLCSGLMDGLSGQILTVDRGGEFCHEAGGE